MTAKQSDTLDEYSLNLLAAEAGSRYSPDLQGHLSLICRSENATSLRCPNGERFALRVHRGITTSGMKIESELAWLDALRTAAFRCRRR